MVYKQRRYLVVFISAISVFISSFTAFLSTHANWDSFWTPSDVAQVIVMISTFIFTIIGALHFQLPRDPSMFHHDRHSDFRQLPFVAAIPGIPIKQENEKHE